MESYRYPEVSVSSPLLQASLMIQNINTRSLSVQTYLKIVLIHISKRPGMGISRAVTVYENSATKPENVQPYLSPNHGNKNELLPPLTFTLYIVLVGEKVNKQHLTNRESDVSLYFRSCIFHFWTF